MKRVMSIAIVLLILAGFGVWWFSPKQVIQRRTKSLLKVLSIEKDSGRAARMMKPFELNKMLAAEVNLENPEREELNGTLSRTEVESNFSWLCAQAKSSDFSVEEFQNVTVSGDAAEVAFVMKALVEVNDYRPADGNYSVTLSWQKEKDGWRLAAAKWRE
ncbi:MAG: hypothetical protein QM680_02730 [Luteolibacter sp.]